MSVTRSSLLANGAGPPRRPRQLLFEAPSLGEASGIAESLFESNVGDKGAAKNFKVVVRVRPLVEREAGTSHCLQLTNAQTISITKPVTEESDENKMHTFPFDRVFEDSTPQGSLYDACVKPVVLSILEGYNGSIIAYGQTGTGKTFTIEGGEGEARGIIPRTSEDIFGYIENTSTPDSKFLVRASFLQIYNEQISDLLDGGGPRREKRALHVREDAGGGVYVDGLTEHIVKGPSEILELLRQGSGARQTASTKMNLESSRSHAVFTIIVEHSVRGADPDAPTVTIGKLNLVDLAGSERIRSTGVSSGVRMDETKNINRSLSAFGKVILALTSPGNHHVPYRDSKLTRILQGSLGGNCRTTMITAITPAADSYQETLNSLKFAKRAKNVKNFAIVNQDLSEQALLTAYEREIARLRKELELNRRAVPAPGIDQETLVLLKQQHAQLAAEKDQIQSELHQRGQEIAQAQEEKRRLVARLSAMERQLLTGGVKVEDHPQFQAAVLEAEERLKREYENRFEQLEKERRRLAQEKEMFEREKTLFSQRSESFASASPLSTTSSAVITAAVAVALSGDAEGAASAGPPGALHGAWGEQRDGDGHARNGNGAAGGSVGNGSHGGGGLGVGTSSRLSTSSALTSPDARSSHSSALSEMELDEAGIHVVHAPPSAQSDRSAHSAHSTASTFSTISGYSSKSAPAAAGAASAHAQATHNSHLGPSALTHHQSLSSVASVPPSASSSAGAAHAAPTVSSSSPAPIQPFAIGGRSISSCSSGAAGSYPPGSPSSSSAPAVAAHPPHVPANSVSHPISTSSSSSSSSNTTLTSINPTMANLSIDPSATTSVLSHPTATTAAAAARRTHSPVAPPHPRSPGNIRRSRHPTTSSPSPTSSPTPPDEDPPPLLTRYSVDVGSGVHRAAPSSHARRATSISAGSGGSGSGMASAAVASSWIPEADEVPMPSLAPETEDDVAAALEDYIKALRDPDSGIVTHDLRVDHQFVRGVFSGLDAADWFVNNMHGVHTLADAQAVGQKFVALGLLIPVMAGPTFEPTEKSLYRLAEYDSRAAAKVVAHPAVLRAAPVEHAHHVHAPVPVPPSTARPPSARPASARPTTAASTHLRTSPPSSQQQSPGRRSTTFSVVASDATGVLANAGSLLQRYASVPSPGTPSSPAPTASGAAAAAAAAGARLSSPTMLIAGIEGEEGATLEEEYGATLLHSAAGQGDRNAMRTFLQTFPVDCPDHLGRTPLMYASIGNRVKAVEMLLRQGASPSITDGNGRTALLWAAYYGHVEIVRVLVKHDRGLVELGDPDGRTAIHWATKHESTRCLDLLLRVSSGPVINAQDAEQVTALHWAVLCQHQEHVQHLVKAGADARILDAEGRTAMHYAVSNDSARCLRVLLEHAEDVINAKDMRGRAALHLAISGESPLEMVNALLGSLLCDVNCTDTRMTTPLHWAAVCNRPDICKALGQRGAVLSFRDTNGMTPLHYAIQKGYSECAAVLQKMAAMASQKQKGSSTDLRPMAAVSRA